jgi:hypothetical protein
MLIIGFIHDKNNEIIDSKIIKLKTKKIRDILFCYITDDIVFETSNKGFVIAKLAVYQNDVYVDTFQYDVHIDHGIDYNKLVISDLCFGYDVKKHQIIQ